MQTGRQPPAWTARSAFSRRALLQALCAGALGAGFARPAFAQVRERVREKPSERAGERPTGGSERSLNHAGFRRTYRLHFPAGMKPPKPAPLVVVLHGMGANGALTEALTRFSEVADQNGFTVAYPDGLNKLWRYWSDDDPAFILAVADELIREGVADPRRVHVCGISNGAYLTNVLACDHADRFAAVAAVAGTLPKMKAERLTAVKPMPTLYIHGTDDRLVGFDGTDFLSRREMSLGAAEFVRWRARQNGCTDAPVTDKLPDKADDGATVERITYSPAKAGAEVIFYKVSGGGHTWPGGSAQPERLLGKTCRDFNASQVMWEFFAKHQLPAKP